MNTFSTHAKRLLMLVAVALVTVAAVAQNQTVKVNIKNMYAREAFAQLKEATGMTFVYAEKNVSKTSRVTLPYAQGERLSVVLTSLCQQLGLNYTIKGKLIMLYPAATAKRHRLSLHVTGDDREPMMMARCELQPLGLYAITDVDGKVVIDNIPDGDWTLQVSYVGYNSVSQRISIRRDVSQQIVMHLSSLALKEVVVTAQQKVSGASTSTVIGRQAIDHLQATSLADVMQLIPGQLMGNTDLTSQTNLQLRTLANNNTSAFGSSVVVDGIPMSNNGAVSRHL